MARTVPVKISTPLHWALKMKAAESGVTMNEIIGKYLRSKFDESELASVEKKVEGKNKWSVVVFYTDAPYTAVNAIRNTRALVDDLAIFEDREGTFYDRLGWVVKGYIRGLAGIYKHAAKRLDSK